MESAGLIIPSLAGQKASFVAGPNFPAVRVKPYKSVATLER
jgi:hypothetical protein